jgi:hypothetical protein
MFNSFGDNVGRKDGITAVVVDRHDLPIVRSFHTHRVKTEPQREGSLTGVSMSRNEISVKAV